MLDDLGDHGVKATEIAAWVKNNLNEVLPEQFWELNADLCEGILSERWEPLTDLDKFQRLFELVELWPTYSTTSFLPRLLLEEPDADAVEFLWKKVATILGQAPNALREAIEYVLWVDFFEDQSVSGKAWSGLMNACPSSKAMARLLANSGPVPYSQKKNQYRALLADPDDHEILAECLARSLEDVYGDIDRIEAKELFAQLQLDSSNKFMRYLGENL